MSTGYSWEGIRQVRATLLGARHVPEHLCGGYVYLGRYISVRPLPFTFYCHANTATGHQDKSVADRQTIYVTFLH